MDEQRRFSNVRRTSCASTLTTTTTPRHRFSSMGEIHLGCYTPSQILQRALFSVGGIDWTITKRHIKLWPVRFHKQEVELAYREEIALENKASIPLAASLVMLTTFTHTIALSLSFSFNWLGLRRTLPAHIALALASVSILGPLLLLYLHQLEQDTRRQELIYYSICFTNMMPVVIWCVLSTYMAASAPHFSWLRYVLPAETIVLSHAMIAECLISTTTVAILFVTDSMIRSTTRLSLLFHVTCFIFTAAVKLIIDRTLSTVGIEVCTAWGLCSLALLCAAAYGCAYCRAIGHRASKCSVYEVQQRLAQLHTFMNPDHFTDISPAEQLACLLINSLDHIEAYTSTLTKHGEEGVRVSLMQANGHMEECMDWLARGQARKGRSLSCITEGSFDRNSDFAGEAFVQLWSGAEYVQEIQKHKRKPSIRRKTITKRDSNKRCDVLIIDGTILPTQRVSLTLQAIVGTAVEADLLEACDEASIVTGVGLILAQPILPFLRVVPEVVYSCFFAIQSAYWQNPFTNATHAAFVAHQAFAMTKSLSLRYGLTQLENTALLLATLGHDIAHTGRGNSFYVKSNNLLAIVQNDRSVLESFHYAILLEYMTSCGEVDILCNLSRPEILSIRHLVCKLILATDNSRHHEQISKFRVSKLAPEFDPLNDTNYRHVYLDILMMAADVGWSILNWVSHYEWALRQLEEAFQQGDHEEALGLPITPLCDRNTSTPLAHIMFNFLSHTAAPIFDEIASVDIEAEEWFQRLNENLMQWEQIMASGGVVKIPRKIADMRIAHHHYLYLHVRRCYNSKQFKDLLNIAEDLEDLNGI